MDQSRQDRVQNIVKVFAQIFRKESQNKISVLLKQRILPAVPPVRVGVRQMLVAVQLDDHPGLGAEQIHLHLTSAVEGYGQLYIQAETVR